MRSLFLFLLLFATPARAQVADAPAIADRRDLPLAPAAPGATHRISLTLAYFYGGGWHPEAIGLGHRLLQRWDRRRQPQSTVAGVAAGHVHP